MNAVTASEFTTRIQPGTYRAATGCTITLCRAQGDQRQELEYAEYKAGEIIEIPKTVNGFWYGLDPNGNSFDGYHEAIIEGVTNYGLYDSDTAEALTYDELGITVEEYEAAIRESLDCGQPEGHILMGERRVYAAE